MNHEKLRESISKILVNWQMPTRQAAISEIEKLFADEQKLLLSTTMNVLTDKWDKVESQDPDTSMETWRNYKHIRNNTRDWIKEIASAKGIEL